MLLVYNRGLHLFSQLLGTDTTVLIRVVGRHDGHLGERTDGIAKAVHLGVLEVLRMIGKHLILFEGLSHTGGNDLEFISQIEGICGVSDDLRFGRDGTCLSGFVLDDNKSDIGIDVDYFAILFGIDDEIIREVKLYSFIEAI